MLKMMSWLLLLNVAEAKKKRPKKIDGFRKKLVIPEFKISECSEHEVKTEIGHIFVNEKTLEKYSVKIHEIDPYFYEHYKKKHTQLDENGHEYILFRINVCFNEYLLAEEIDEKKCWQRSYFWGEKPRSARKKLSFKFIGINTSKEGYDVDYEVGGIKTFISKLKDQWI